MRTIIEIQRKLLPDLLPVLQKRYDILKYIHLMQPIGRRTLSTNLGQSERVLRSEVQFLKEQNLLEISTAGMSLTKDGLSLLNELDFIMKEVSGLTVLEAKLKEKLKVKDVIVVPGDSDVSPWVKKELGRACVACIKERLFGNNIVAVTGGTTLSTIADMMTLDSRTKDLLYVPARGGLGEEVDNQANTICAKMAAKTSGKYRLLHVPEMVSNKAYQSLVAERSIQTVLALIQASSMVIHGIGDAITMAERRKTDPKDMEKIKAENAVAEAFGYYFNREGKVVHKVQTIGIQLDDLKNIKNVVAVAGGTSKADAIEAFVKQGHDSLLITDEGAAKQLIMG